MLSRLLTSILVVMFIPTVMACDVFDELYEQHVVQDRVLFFGEIHGNRQMPALFGDVACEILNRGESLSVGLEVSQNSQANIDAFFIAPNLGKGLQILLDDAHWQGADGRSSEDMLFLVQRLYQLNRDYRGQLQVYSFSAQPPNRPTKMYVNIKNAIEESSKSHHIVLSGNLHSQTEIGIHGDEAYRPTAYLMREAGFDIASYILRYSSGDAWLCSDACYTHSLPGGFRQGEHRTPVRSRPEFFKHDFEISIGEMKSSLPVFKQEPVD